MLTVLYIGLSLIYSIGFYETTRRLPLSMDTPSRNTRSKTKNTPLKKEIIKKTILQSPFVYTPIERTEENDEIKNNLVVETPNAWLKFKTAMNEKDKKQNVPEIKLSHLDSLELRNRVIPRSDLEKRNSKQIDFIEKTIGGIESKASKDNLNSIFMKKKELFYFILVCFLILIASFLFKRRSFDYKAERNTFLVFQEKIYKIILNVEKKQSRQEKVLSEERNKLDRLEPKIRELDQELSQIRNGLKKGTKEVSFDLVIEKLKSFIPNYLVVWRDGEELKISEDFVSFLKKFILTERTEETLEEVRAEIDLLRTKINSTYKGLTRQEAAEQIKKEIKNSVEVFHDRSIKEMVGRLVKKELKNRERNYSIDYALKANGGSVVKKYTTRKYSSAGRVLSLLGIGVRGKEPDVALTEDMGVGNCWSFNGEQGVLTVRLSRKIFVKEIELKHIPWTISPYRSKSSVKEFSVYGYNTEELEAQRKGVELVSGVYDLHGKESQIFGTKDTEKEIEFVSLKIKSNNGEGFTCVYRFGVFGVPEETADS